MLRELFLGFIRVHILYHASLAPVYGLELIRELEDHGYHVSPGTMYPILSKLEADGLLISEKINVEGKIRKYYSLTKEGCAILEEAKVKVKELALEIFEER
ncbi:PadR family transcriptional regulator [Desulforamulus aquiferis]|uniref:PadR family transcriptional regulator n=1 Tax=Desulforamulus aquiferis TaxID=1397668 RepID=A0AAW7Z948_9FIRM|nr:PadR family transcriptional regulator [Desulforamulus aquiferis]MDO7785654.1 PadR family transcriptional regulator [Desulforamulus aquiferis]RYD03246.1 PadR family transcriptional regulator [Desulforamulus aquiferis]